MTSFFSPEFTTGSNSLPKEELGHAIKSLRLKTGDDIALLNGCGHVFTAVIIERKNDVVRFEITREKFIEKRKPLLHLAISPVKNSDRYEWLVEKATELGVDEISPVICKRTERYRIKLERLNKIMVSAVKQSGNPYLPVLNDIVPFSSFIKEDHSSPKLIAHCVTLDKKSLNDYQTRDAITILIGPEGDFDENEISAAISEGFKPVSLGDNTLRTETAGVAVCSFFQLNY